MKPATLEPRRLTSLRATPVGVPLDERDSVHSETLACTDPPHALVGLPLHGDLRGGNAQSTGNRVCMPST